MRLIRHCLIAAAVVTSAVCVLCGPAVAAPVAPGRWELLEPASPGSPGKTSDPGVFRSPSGTLYVAWIHQDGPLDESLKTDAFASDGSLPSAQGVAAAHWTNLSDAAFWDPGTLFFGGQQGTTAGSPLGLMIADGFFDGVQVWPTVEPLTDTYGTVSVAGSGSELYQAFESQSRPAIHVGLGSSPLLYPTSGIAGIAESSPNIVRDGGSATVAWCGFGDGVGGVFTQQLDFATSQMAGTPAALPGSTTSFGGKAYSTCVLQSEVSRRTPMAARTGGGVFVAGTTGYPTLTGVVVWKVGGPTLVAAHSRTGHSEPEVFADPSGRIWVGWVQLGSGAPTLVVRRSNTAATVLGAPVTVKAPAGWQLGSFEGSATAAQLDVIAQFSSADKNSIQHTIVLPGLTLQRTRTVKLTGGRKAVTYRVLDAGAPVSGAKVTTGRAHRTTGATGLVTLTLKGSTHATATKQGYTKATV